MTSTPNAKTATAARVAGFLALFAAGAALLVLFAAAAHAALGASSAQADTPSGCTAPAPRRTSATSTPACARTLADTAGPITSCAPTGRGLPLRPKSDPAHSSSRTYLATLRWNHKTAAAGRKVFTTFMLNVGSDRPRLAALTHREFGDCGGTGHTVAVARTVARNLAVTVI